MSCDTVKSVRSILGLKQKAFLKLKKKFFVKLKIWQNFLQNIHDKCADTLFFGYPIK
jgi:hypothetical protein